MKIYKTLTTFFLAMLLAGNLTHVSAEDEIQKDLDKAAELYNTNKSDDNYKVVCKRETVVGTRIKKKICRTVATMNQARKEARRRMDRVRGSVLSN